MAQLPHMAQRPSLLIVQLEVIAMWVKAKPAPAIQGKIAGHFFKLDEIFSD